MEIISNQILMLTFRRNLVVEKASEVGM